MPFHTIIRIACFSTAALALGANQAHAQAAVQYDIQAGPLAEALNRYAQQSGAAIVFEAGAVQGLRTVGLKGSYGVEEGFNLLLRGSGYVIGKTASGYVLVAAPRPAAAAGAAQEKVMEAVTATGSAETATGPVTGYIARRSGAGTKTDTAIIEVPQSVSVIGAREMEDRGAMTLADVLGQTPGVAVNPYGFDSRAPDWVMLRGFDGWYTSSYRDGLIQNVGMTFLGVQTEIYGLERLEVLRGPASVLFGKGDVGGVVNRVSKIPGADAIRELGVQLGRYGRKQAMADLGGVLDTEGRWLWRAVGVGLETGTQDRYPNGERMTQKRKYFAPSLTWQATPRTSLTLQAEILRDDGSDDVQYVSAADGSPSNVKEGDPTYSRIQTDSDAIGYQLNHRFDGGWLLKQNMRYAHRSMDKHHMVSFFDTDPNELLRQARHDIESVNESAIDTSLQGTVAAAGVTHRLLFGVDYDRARAEWGRWQAMTGSLDMAHPVYGVHIDEPTAQSRDKQVISEQIGIYAQDQVRIDEHWGLTAGLRQDRARTRLNDRLGGVQDRRTDNATTGRLGLSYQVGNGWAPYLSYGQSFVPVLAIDDDVMFDPSRGKQVELGVKYMPEGRPLSFTAAIYNLEKTNVVSYDPVDFVPHAIGTVRSRGLELEGRAEMDRQLALIASYTALDMKILSSAIPEEVGRMPILTPKQTASLWLDYALGADLLPGVSVSGGLRYTGKRWNDAANTSCEAGYTLADAAIRYDNGPWRLALNVSNLFDKSYLSGHSYGSYFRGNGRNVILNARYRW